MEDLFEAARMGAVVSRWWIGDPQPASVVMLFFWMAVGAWCGAMTFGVVELFGRWRR